jgi:hypothetical protein
MTFSIHFFKVLTWASHVRRECERYQNLTALELLKEIKRMSFRLPVLSQFYRLFASRLDVWLVNITLNIQNLVINQ